MYFPQEQVIHPDCKNTADPNSCLRQNISLKLVSLLNEAIAQNKFSKDTLIAQVVFEVDKKGKLLEGRDFTYINDSLLRNDYEGQLRAITKGLPQMEVLYKKPKPYVSSHKLLFYFLVDKSTTAIQLTPIEKPDTAYTGGIIAEVPQFPGCKRGDDSKARACFQKLMQKHIATNFRYPQEAHERELQGRVSIMFKINEEGNIENIRTRGPHKLLEEEAIRIIKLLPKFGPALSNGEPVKIPFAIPITFRLQ